MSGGEAQTGIFVDGPICAPKFLQIAGEPLRNRCKLVAALKQGLILFNELLNVRARSCVAVEKIGTRDSWQLLFNDFCHFHFHHPKAQKHRSTEEFRGIVYRIIQLFLKLGDLSDHRLIIPTDAFDANGDFPGNRHRQSQLFSVTADIFCERDRGSRNANSIPSPVHPYQVLVTVLLVAIIMTHSLNRKKSSGDSHGTSDKRLPFGHPAFSRREVCKRKAAKYTDHDADQITNGLQTPVMQQPIHNVVHPQDRPPLTEAMILARLISTMHRRCHI